MRGIIPTILVIAGVAIVHGQAPTLTPADNLVVQGIPSIPASIVRDVARYADSRSAAFADWHPQRRELLISTRFANAAQIHVVKMPGGHSSRSSRSRSPTRCTSRRRARTSSSCATPAAMNSARSIATTSPTAGSR